MTQVVNLKAERYDVYIGRAKGERGVFGNPFQIGADGTREEVVEKFREYFHRRLRDDPEFKRRVLGLKGKVLGCFCAPEKCHGDVIVGYLEQGEA